MDGEAFWHNYAPWRTSVVVDNFYIMRVSGQPAKANTVLIVHADAVLALTVLGQDLQAVARRNRQVCEFNRRIQNRKFLPGAASKVDREAAALSCLPQQPGICIAEAQDHDSIVMQRVRIVKRSQCSEKDRRRNVEAFAEAGD